MNPKDFVRLFLPPIYYWARTGINPISENTVDKSKDKQEKFICYNYLYEINRRASIKLNNLTALSEDLSFEQLHSVTTNEIEPNFYGSWLVLQKYANIKVPNLPPSGFSIQHGIVYEKTGWEIEKQNNTNFWWSSYIRNLVSDNVNADKNFALGAPFFYADSILSEEDLVKERSRLGRNLLAFPMHSTFSSDNNFDESHFIKLLKDLRKSFDSVRVCLYWKDIQRGSMQKYIDAGFECVCCGHMFDFLFLERQKTLFEIADATISNGVGSHIGYSVFMNKPHWLVPDDFVLSDIRGTLEGKEEQEMKERSGNYKAIKNAFLNNDAFIITDEQRELVDKFWGVSDMKTKSEVKKIILDIYEKSVCRII